MTRSVVTFGTAVLVPAAYVRFHVPITSRAPYSIISSWRLTSGPDYSGSLRCGATSCSMKERNVNGILTPIGAFNALCGKEELPDEPVRPDPQL